MLCLCFTLISSWVDFRPFGFFFSVCQISILFLKYTRRRFFEIVNCMLYIDKRVSNKTSNTFHYRKIRNTQRNFSEGECSFLRQLSNYVRKKDWFGKQQKCYKFPFRVKSSTNLLRRQNKILISFFRFHHSVFTV